MSESRSWYFGRLALMAFLQGVQDRRSGHFVSNPYPTNRHHLNIRRDLPDGYKMGNMWARGYWFEDARARSRQSLEPSIRGCVETGE